MLDRILGVFKLDVNTFEAIEHDTTATTQAALVVLITALLGGLGTGLLSIFGGTGTFFSTFISGLIWAFVAWLIWAVVSWFVGTKLFGGQATIDEMLRVLGFAVAPQMLGVIPCVGQFIGWIWSLAAGFIAIRQGLDLDNGKAFLTAIIGFIIVIIGYALIGIVMGGTSALFGALTSP
jgi:hypothetical protein